MQTTLKTLGVGALGLTIVPPVLFMAKALTEPTMKGLMLIACALWFATAPFFMKGGSD